MEKDPNCHYIYLTDITLHYQKPVNPKSFPEAIRKSLRSNRPGRVYSQLEPRLSFDDKKREVQFSLPLSPDIQTEMAQAQANGKKVVIVIPKGGLPILTGKDLIEKMQADKRMIKRINQKQ